MTVIPLIRDFTYHRQAFSYFTDTVCMNINICLPFKCKPRTIIARTLKMGMHPNHPHVSLVSLSSSRRICNTTTYSCKSTGADCEYISQVCQCVLLQYSDDTGSRTLSKKRIVDQTIFFHKGSFRDDCNTHHSLIVNVKIYSTDNCCPKNVQLDSHLRYEILCQPDNHHF
jgi:hypothetical protein